MNEISNNNNSNNKLNTAEELYYRPYNTGKLNTMTTIAEKNKFLSKQNNHVVEPNQDESDNLLTEKSHLRGIYEIVDGYSCMQTKITVEVEVPDDDKEKVTVWLTPKENAPKLSKSKTKIQSGQSFTFVIPIGTNINAYLLHAELDGYTCNLYEENVLQAENKLICERNCCICLEKGSKNVKLPCKHDFHPRCIKKWFNMQVHQAHEKRKVPKINCPLCKKEVEIMYNLSISISLVIGKNDDYNDATNLADEAFKKIIAVDGLNYFRIKIEPKKLSSDVLNLNFNLGTIDNALLIFLFKKVSLDNFDRQFSESVYIIIIIFSDD
jgi:hypothetical protein